ncbi:MAG: S8 family serine peptidase [Bacteroidales bacterium]|nr:S8 family serine peptidase [Bacteroidales bacterium]
MKSSDLRTFIMAGFFVLLANFVNAQNASDNYDLLLKFGQVNMVENVDEYTNNFSASDQDVYNGYLYKIIQFYAIPTNAEKQMMENMGLQFLDYIPNKAYTVAIPSNFNFQVFKSLNVRNISDIIPEYKQDMYLLDKNYPAYALRPDDQIDLMVSFYMNIPYNTVRNELTGYTHLLLQDEAIANYQIIRTDISNIESIVSQPFVSFVEPVYPPGEPENYTGKTQHRSNVLDSDYAAGRHYDGTGVNVMLQDDGIIGPHIDYEGRIGDQFLTNNSGDHGDHCAGIIFGSGNLDPRLAGQAPGAQLYVYQAAPLYPGFSNIPNHYNTYDIRITSTSYSDGCNAGYTSLARTMDLQIIGYPALMHVFSAGNDGSSDCGYGAGAGWGNVTGGHKIGKNVIATANLDYADGLSGSSSRGPAHDGRIKPDISAKGSSVNSTTNPNSYTVKSGTSMACPAISGTLAQLYQAYRDLNGGADPKGGFIKALVLNTADDLLNKGPDFKTGWGRINARRAVEALEEERYMTDEISQGENNSHTIEVPTGVKEVKVMVYWTDKEGNVGTSKALVNDINITMTDPSNGEHLPWLLNHYPHPDSLNKPAIKGIDNLNNMEQVSITDPQAGSYSLHVNGFEIPFGPQEYFVMYEFILEEVVLTYPIGGESFTPGENITVRWDSYDTEENFTLEYSTDAGANWTVANSNINASMRQYNMTLPTELTGQAMVRISNGGSSSSSDEVFSIMYVPDEIEFVRACPTTVLIKWETVQDAESYDVYMLGEKYMEVIGTTPTDSLLVEDISFENEYWFSVSANGPNDAKSRRAVAVMKSPGVWNCIFSKDMALSDIISPPIGVLFGCQDFSDVPVRIEITNGGQEAMSDITMNYQFEGGSVMTEVYNGTLQPGESYIHEFASSVSLPSNGIYDLSAWIETDGDQNASNDIITGACKLKTAQSAPINQNISFDEFNQCSWDPDCEDINCYIDNEWYNLQNGLNDQIDWRLMNGITPTPNTGPIGDHTTGTLAGNFLYLEGSGDCKDKKAVLMSPCIDLTGLANPGMSFWFNMYGADMGSLHIDVISDGMLYKDVIVPISGDQGQGWKEAFAFFADFAGKEINVRFRGYTGMDELCDLAIDDISISDLTNVPNISNELWLQVYPNPSIGTYTINFAKERNVEMQVKVVDITGKTIFADSFNTGDLIQNSYQFDISENNQGVYYLMIESEGIKYTEKLLKL